MALPEWEDWGRLFDNGVAAFVLFPVYTVAPLAVAWVPPPCAALGGRGLEQLPADDAGVGARFLLTASGIYLHQKRADYRDAFRPLPPPLALAELLVMGLPLPPFFGFAGFAVPGTTYAAMFRQAGMDPRGAVRRR